MQIEQPRHDNPDKHPNKHHLAVMLPMQNPSHVGHISLGKFSLKLWHGLALICVCLLFSSAIYAVGDPSQESASQESALATLFKWMPLLLTGFMFNIIISVCSMTLGTFVGIFLGLGQISLNPLIRKAAWFITQFFRNAPWLVLLFFTIFVLPFEFKIGPFTIPFPDWMKAIVGLSLPVMANISEIVRGAVVSLPSGQWEAAESLAYSRRQTLWLIILPQCIKRMLPSWMNLYAILTMATVLASIVGVSEVMTLTGDALGSEGGSTNLLALFYSFVLLLFFVYCYPIARWTVYLEKKYAVNN